MTALRTGRLAGVGLMLLMLVTGYGCGNSATNVVVSVTTPRPASTPSPGRGGPPRTAIVSHADYVGAAVAPAPKPRTPACTKFASPRGHASASGRSARAPTSLARAVDRTRAGGVVCLETGTYDVGSTVWLARSGTASSPIVYRGYRGRPLIRYTGGASDPAALAGAVLETRSGPGWRGTHNLVIEHLAIDGGGLMGGGIAAIQGSHHITIRDCVIRNTGSSGIELNAIDHATVENNLIYHAGYSQGNSSGISLWYGGQSPVYGGASAWYDRAAGFHNVIADNVVSGTYDNSSAHNDGNGIIIDGYGSLPPALIVDNITYENGGRGIEINNDGGQAWVVNNTAYADGLDPRVGSGQAPEFGAFYSKDVHFINDIADGRQVSSRYSDAIVFFNLDSTIRWAHDIGFNGSTLGIGQINGEPSAYRRTALRFVAAPVIPGSAAPWRRALPPWKLGGGLALQPGSPALHGGIDASRTDGLSPALSSTLRRYVSRVDPQTGG